MDGGDTLASAARNVLTMRVDEVSRRTVLFIEFTSSASRRSSAITFTAGRDCQIDALFADWHAALLMMIDSPFASAYGVAAHCCRRADLITRSLAPADATMPRRPRRDSCCRRRPLFF